MKSETKRTKKNNRAAEAELSHDVMMRRAAEQEAEATERRRRRKRNRIIGWSIAIPLIGALAALLTIATIESERALEESRATIANTKIEYQAEPVQVLLGRVDGSYYSVSEDKYGTPVYTYSTPGLNGNVETRTVSNLIREEGGLLWFPILVSVDVNVRVIPDDDAESEPRVTFERCTIEPIDPSGPAFQGDPHSEVLFELGTGKPLDVMTQLCEDRITFWVPDGTLQPE